MIGDLAGSIASGGIDDGITAFHKYGALAGAARLRATAMHGARHALVECSIAGGAGLAAYRATPSLDSALLAANLGAWWVARLPPS